MPVKSCNFEENRYQQDRSRALRPTSSTQVRRVPPILRKALYLSLGILLTAPCWAEDNASGQDPKEVTLEELMSVRLVAANVLGIHHTHPIGEWMASYRYMPMRMMGNRVGTHRVSASEVLQDFMVTPTDMDMGMHMFGLMYAPSNKLTLMTMVPYSRLSMNHLTRMGSRFTTQSDGLGDIQVSALYTFERQEHDLFHFDIGLSVPTGSIDKRDDTPAGPNQRLPYPMQLGSGTFDPKIGITYLGAMNEWSWGAHAAGIFRVGENSMHYTLGNRYVLEGWGSYRLNRWLSSSVRTTSTIWEHIHGADPSLNPMMVPTAVPDLQSGNRLELSLGLNFFVASHKFFGNRLAAEFTVPLYQSLEGPQLERDWALSLGWQYFWSF